jgi:hypothetical protein
MLDDFCLEVRVGIVQFNDVSSCLFADEGTDVFLESAVGQDDLPIEGT